MTHPCEQSIDLFRLIVGRRGLDARMHFWTYNYTITLEVDKVPYGRGAVVAWEIIGETAVWLRRVVLLVALIRVSLWGGRVCSTGKSEQSPTWSGHALVALVRRSFFKASKQ